MDGGTAATTLTALLEMVSQLFTALGSAMTSITAYWWVFLPLAFTAFSFIIGAAKGLLGYRRSRRRR